MPFPIREFLKYTLVMSVCCFVFGAVSPCQAKCAGERCGVEDLRKDDVQLDDTYSELLQKISLKEAEALRKEQRTWLRDRDHQCKSAFDSMDTDAWLNFVGDDAQRLQCVLGVTKKRLDEVEARLDSVRSQLKAAAAPQATASKPPIAVRKYDVSATDDREYEFRSSETRSSGKWYFEVKVNPRSIKPENETLVVAGVASEGMTLGANIPLRVTKMQLDFSQGGGVTLIGGGSLSGLKVDSFVVGVAVDLERGKLYERRDGVWPHGEPGSSGGVDIPRQRDYQFRVLSGIPMAKLTETSLLVVNFGEWAFAGELPVGYLPVTGSVSDIVPRPSALVPPDEVVAGKSQAQWSKAYWAWSEQFDAGAPPTVDKSGEHCAKHQMGPVWFLAGVVNSEPVERHCSPPRRSHVFFPIITAGGKRDDNDPSRCRAGVEQITQLMGQVSGIRVAIDGQQIGNATLWRQQFACENIPTREGERLYSSDGYWMMLRPLSPGDHEITVRARLPSMSVEKHVTYHLNIRP